MQVIIKIKDDINIIDEYLKELNAAKMLLVCGGSIKYLKYDSYFESLQKRTGIEVVRFSDFSPNPDYQSVVNGVELLRKEQCDMIVAVGGGSAIDVAKCIKLFANMDGGNYLEQMIVPNDIPFMVIPTTAGTGSEATHFAVIYYKGEKKSVADQSSIPGIVVFDSSVLDKLPVYQKKATMMDAFCHAVESFWSVNSTDESKEYSKEALSLLLDNMDGYLDDHKASDMPDINGCLGDEVIDSNVRINHNAYNENMQRAAYLAGKAINITQTTAGHAMCYKLTSLYGIAHGHAAALCVSKLFPYMVSHTEDFSDARGKEYLDSMFLELSKALKCENTDPAYGFIERLIAKLELTIPKASDEDYEMLRRSVNAERLKNNPVRLSEEVIDMLYREILYTDVYIE